MGNKFWALLGIEPGLLCTKVKDLDYCETHYNHAFPFPVCLTDPKGHMRMSASLGYWPRQTFFPHLK